MHALRYFYLMHVFGAHGPDVIAACVSFGCIVAIIVCLVWREDQ
jgi:hypothetical protein